MVEVVFDAVNVQVLEAECRGQGCEGEYRYEKPELPQHVWRSVETKRADVWDTGGDVGAGLRRWG